MKPKYLDDLFTAESSDMKYSVWQLIIVDEGNIKNEVGMSHCLVSTLCGRPLNQLELHSREFLLNGVDHY